MQEMRERKSLVLILGGTSDIGRAVANRFAAGGADIALAARVIDRLQDDAADLQLRFACAVSLHAYDAAREDAAERLLAGLPRLPDTVICCVGLLPAEPMSSDPDKIREALRSNGEGPIIFLSLCADRFKARGHGAIVAIASVAGLRGRASNGLYGAGKAMLIAYLSALRNQTSDTAIRVITVLPGFVDTRMTASLVLPASLTAQPDEVAVAVLRALSGRRDVVYVRPVWRWIMLVITSLPEFVFKRLRF